MTIWHPFDINIFKPIVIFLRLAPNVDINEPNSLKCEAGKAVIQQIIDDTPGSPTET